MARSPLRRIVRAIGALIGFAAFVALGAALAWSFAVQNISATAFQLDDVDLGLGSAAVTRAAVVQSVVFAVDNANGVASDESLGLAFDEAVANLEAYDQLLTELEAGSVPTDLVILGRLSVVGWSVIELIDAGEVSEARALAEGEFETGYAAAVGELGAVRTTLAVQLETASGLAGRLGNALRLAATVILPVLTIVLFSGLARRRVTKERRRSSDEMAALGAQLDEKDELLASVSHRFRTPLTSIFGLSDVLLQTKRISGLDRELAALINAESADLYRIADDVLTASQLRAGKLEASTSIVALATVVDDAAKPLAAAGVEIKVDCPEIWVVTDGDKLRQILRNLLSNASKHGAEPVFVEISEIEGYVQCSVVDHGPGLPETLFETHGLEASSGLGLPVAFALAELIGARMEWSRTEDQTRFTLSLSGDIPLPSQDVPRQVIKSIPKPIVRRTVAAEE